VADHQTAGRGRLDRKWEAPAGSALLMSILLRPSELPDERRHLVTAAVALSAAEAGESVTGGAVAPALKWPNDLVVDDRKLAGVLSEVGAGAIVVGIGINLTSAPEGAARLDEGGTPVARDDVLDTTLERLADRYGSWDEVASAYRRRCMTIGRDVRVELHDETFTGVAADITEDGHLLVDVGMCLRTVTAGDVVHLRSAT